MKDDKLYRYHIIESIDKIMLYVDGKTCEDFLESTMIQDAVLRNLQVLAESTQRLSPEFKTTHSAIEWYKIAGLRNILVHDYLGIDLTSGWNVIESHLPRLQSAVSF